MLSSPSSFLPPIHAFQGGTDNWSLQLAQVGAKERGGRQMKGILMQ